MVKVLPGSDGNTLGIQVSGNLTSKDYEEVMIPKLEELINKHGKARFLCYLDEDFSGMEMGAMVDDAKFFLKHKDDLEKTAVVGAAFWIEMLTTMFAHVMQGEVKTFPGEQLDAAWEWIKA
jgi:hypothetical protein